MHPVAIPDPATWRARSARFWRVHDVNAGPQPLDLGPRATALVEELEAVYCAGAWSAVVILAWTIVEAEERARDRAGAPPREAPDLDWLRERRNALVHVGGDAEMPEEKDLQTTAEGAVRIVFKTLFEGAWR